MEPRTYLITVEESGATFPCREDQFLLAAMIAARCGPVTHGCGGGGCGVCRMQVVLGEYTVAKRMSRAHVSAAEEQGNIILLCCVKPLSDMCISTPQRMDDRKQ